jgi:spermidine/putrescine transport system permease protein
MSAVTTPAPQAGTLPPAVVRKPRRRWTFYILPVFTIATILYLTAPVIVMFVYSFNELSGTGERMVPRFTCCTLRWWQEILGVPALNEAIRVSLIVAPISAAFAAILGTLIGLVLGRYPFRGRGATNFVVFLAIAVPEIVLASALLSWFVQWNQWEVFGFTWDFGMPTILFSHIGFSIAFVAITVRARVQGLDRSLENAAQDLFATPVVAFFKVTLPLILPGVIAGFLLAFVLSLDDFVITNFVKGQTNTLPTWVYGTAKIGIPPQVNVWGTVLFGVGVLLAIVNLVSARRAART